MICVSILATLIILRSLFMFLLEELNVGITSVEEKMKGNKTVSNRNIKVLRFGYDVSVLIRINFG